MAKRKSVKEPIRVIDKLDQAPDESIEHYYRRLAKQADQRLVRLEAYSYDKGYKRIKNWAYRKALKDIKHWSGEDATRFNTSPPTKQKGEVKIVDTQKLEAKIRDIRSFLEMPTSTKSGVMATYKNRAASINASQGTNLTWEQLADLFENDQTKDLIKDYDSGKTLRVYNEIVHGNAKILDPKNKDDQAKIDKLNEENKKIVELVELKEGRILQVEDRFIGETIKEMLDDQAISEDFIMSGGKKG